MTLEGSTLAHLGIFLSINMATGFITEIPTGYLSDRIGHKKTLVIGKISMILSTVFLLLGTGFWYFAAYYIFFALALALRSGTLQAFTHETLDALGKGDKYGNIMSRIKGNASLLSVFFIVLYPVLYSVDPFWAFGTALVIDVIGLVVAIWLKAPPLDTRKIKQDIRSLWSLFDDFFKAKSFLTVVLVGAGSRAVFFSTGAFREPYLMEIGYPIAMIGLVMGLSRFFRFIFGRAVGAMKQMVSLKRLVAIDFSVMSIGFALIALAPLPWYLMGLAFSLLIGFYYARGPLYMHYLLEFIPDKKYKATLLSIKGLIESIFGMVVPLAIGYTMAVGYTEGHILIAGLFAVIGVVGYGFVRKMDCR